MKLKNRIICFLLSLTMILLLVGCSFKSSKTKTVLPQNDFINKFFNSKNLGLVTSDAENIYYSDTVNNKICSYSFESEKYTKICDAAAYNLVLFNDKIYYINENDGKINFINANGDNVTVSDFSVVNFIAYKDKIYCKVLDENASGIYSVSKDNSTDLITDDVVEDMFLYQDRIYYTCKNANDNIDLKAVYLDGSNEVLIKSDNIAMFFIYNDLIFYAHTTPYQKICSMDLNGKNSRVILDNVEILPRLTNVWDNMFYYRDMLAGGKYFKMNLDSGEVVSIDNSTTYYPLYICNGMLIDVGNSKPILLPLERWQ